MDIFKNKFVTIGTSLVLIVIVIILGIVFVNKQKAISYTTLIATDGSFSVDFPLELPYVVNSKENNEFVIDLYSEKEEMFFYATKIAKSREIDFASVVSKDKENYLKDKQDIREDFGIVPFSLKNYTAFEYRFVYHDSLYGKDFYCNVLWVETETSFYILNFEVVNENREKFEEIFEKIKVSFAEL